MLTEAQVVVLRAIYQAWRDAADTPPHRDIVAAYSRLTAALVNHADALITAAEQAARQA